MSGHDKDTNAGGSGRPERANVEHGCIERSTAPNADRRRVLGAALSTAGLLCIPKFARGARRRTLRIAQWNHFVPEFDRWFEDDFARTWGEANDVDVVIDRVGMTSLHSRARAEVERQRGHDLFMFLRPPPSFETHVIDHREIHEECRQRYGKPVELAERSSYNPTTGKYYAFSESYVPDPINYRKDLWDDVGVHPDSWDDIRRGAAKIYQRHRIPVGMGMAPELDTNMALRSLLHSFGGSIQDADGTPVLKSPQTLEAVRFAKALYEEAATDEVFTWDPSSNNRMMLAGHGSLTLNAISITRTGEAQRISYADRIALARAAAGPVRRIGLIHLMHSYVIWSFSANQDIASRFLVDYVGRFRDAFLASRFYNFPCYPGTVPDLKTLIADDSAARPRDKYKVLEDVADWTTNVGYPGYANAAVDETFSRWVISDMFASAARGKLSPSEAVAAADRSVREIFARWRSAGLL